MFWQKGKREGLGSRHRWSWPKKGLLLLQKVNSLIKLGVDLAVAVLFEHSTISKP